MKAALGQAVVLAALLLMGTVVQAQDKPKPDPIPGTSQNGEKKNGEKKSEADTTKSDAKPGQKPDTSKPASPTAAELNAKAEDLMKQMKFEEAIVVLRQAITLDKNNIQSHADLGNAYTGAKRYNEAVEEYRKVVELNPRYPPFQAR